MLTFHSLRFETTTRNLRSQEKSLARGVGDSNEIIKVVERNTVVEQEMVVKRNLKIER